MPGVSKYWRLNLANYRRNRRSGKSEPKVRPRGWWFWLTSFMKFTLNRMFQMRWTVSLEKELAEIGFQIKTPVRLLRQLPLWSLTNQLQRLRPLCLQLLGFDLTPSRATHFLLIILILRTWWHFLCPEFTMGHIQTISDTLTIFILNSELLF